MVGIKNMPIIIAWVIQEKVRQYVLEEDCGQTNLIKTLFLKKFIEKIIIYDEKIEIIYYAPEPKSVLSKISDVEAYHL